MIRVKKEENKLIIEINENEIKISETQGYILTRQLANALGLSVNTRNPIISYRNEGTAIVADIIEGNISRRFVIRKEIINSYIKAIIAFQNGKYKLRTIAEKAFIEARKLKIRDVEQFLDGSKLNWELLFGTRKKYYELVRVPILLLSKMGFVEYSARWISIKKSKMKNKLSF